jgi:hypothetical protein
MRMPTRSADLSSATRGSALESTPALDWGIVGHYADSLTEDGPDFDKPDPTPAYVFAVNGQWMVELTLLPDGEEVIARIGLDGAGAGFGDYIDLPFGARVIVARAGDADSGYVVLAAMNDAERRAPDTVAGVSTGMAAAVPGSDVNPPGPRWRFIKTAPGALLAIETQAGGDVLIHSAGSVEMRAGALGAIHLSGRVALGQSPLTPPVGATVGPAGTTIPGTPAVPYVPIPKVATTPAPPLTILPFAGFDDSIIRAKDRIQSHIAVDPEFWAWVLGVHTFPLLLAWLVGLPVPLADPPIVLHSEHGGLGGPGSQHTASD